MWVRSLGREDPLEEGTGNPLHYSCLENPMDRGAWRATVHSVHRVGYNWSNLAHTHLVSICWALMMCQAPYIWSSPNLFRQVLLLSTFPFLFFWLSCTACGILVSPPGIEPAPSAVDVRCLNRWTTREVPLSLFYRWRFWGRGRLCTFSWYTQLEKLGLWFQPMCLTHAILPFSPYPRLIHLMFGMCLWGFPGHPGVENLPPNAGSMDSVPGQGTKILHATEQLSQN